MPESFKCPSCSAPLEYEGKAMQRCRFCNSTVIVPSSLGTQANTINYGDLSDVKGKAMKIAEIHAALRAGKKINAIKIFKETFGVGLKEAKDAVDAMDCGESVDLSGMYVKIARHENAAQNRDVAKKVGYTIGGSILLTALAVLLLAGGIVAAAFYFASRVIDRELERPGAAESSPPKNNPGGQNGNPQSGEQKSSFAQESLKFGGEGIGAGKFKDNRSIAVDADGKIYSADYTGGRIQIFDANGQFQTQLTVDASMPLHDLAIDRKGNLFVLQGIEILRFDTKTGEFRGKQKIANAEALTVGLDGKFYVATGRGEIFALNEAGAKTKTIRIGEDTTLKGIEKLAIDGAGNFYAIDGETHSIFKLSPEGKFVTRFAGEPKGNMPKRMFTSEPQNLAVDSKGRIFVSQISKVSVYDSNGTLLDDFDTTQTFGLAFNDAGELFTASRPFVVKYKVN